MEKIKLKPSNILIPLVVVIFNLLIIVFPKAVVESAREGSVLWFSNVLPSLLPFVVGTNLMSALGITRKLGRFLEPLMSKLFKISGSGGYALAVGLLSGYPIGAKTTALLREKGEITKQDADRLICFVNNSGPLFILGTVAAGMFENELAGYYLLLVHYLSAIVTGLVFCFLLPYQHEKKEKKTDAVAKNTSIGAQLSKAVTGGMETMLMIGGFIIVFSVILRIFDEIYLFDFLELCLKPALTFLNIDSESFKALFGGIIEMTNGLKTLSQSGISEKNLVMASALVAFGGFSIHAQSISFLSKTDISVSLYLSAKFAQAVLSVIISLIALPFFYEPIKNSQSAAVFSALPSGFIRTIGFSSVFYLAILTCIALIAVICSVVYRKKSRRRRIRFR